MTFELDRRTLFRGATASGLAALAVAGLEESVTAATLQGSLPSKDAAVVLLFSLVASGQIKLRKIDGWQKIGAVLNQQSPVAA